MNRVSAPGYDLFKLIVALILTLILIILLLRGCNPVPPTSVVAPDTPETPETQAPETEAPLLVPTTEEPTDEPTLPAPISPTVMTPTPTATASPEEPPAPVTDTPAPAPVTDTPTPTPAPAPEPAPDTTCNTSMPSRLSVGQAARTLVNLNMRSGPDIKAPLVQTNRAGNRVEIIGGPQCNPQGDRAYLWWQIRLGDGKEGWSAETPLIQMNYFLEPLQ